VWKQADWLIIFWNQEALRSETYQGITDAVGEGNSTGKNLGVQYILHSSFTGGPRYMAQNYHDGMAITRVHGAPDLFITFTCNPKWQEISDALAMEPHQCASDRPDIVTRVFHMKYNEFLTEVKSGELFGPIKACKCNSLLCLSVLFRANSMSCMFHGSCCCSFCFLGTTCTIVVLDYFYRKRNLSIHSANCMFRSHCMLEGAAREIDIV
jgi:hypothetical protein